MNNIKRMYFKIQQISLILDFSCCFLYKFYILYKDNKITKYYRMFDKVIPIFLRLSYGEALHLPYRSRNNQSKINHVL